MTEEMMVSREVANQEFERFCEAMELTFDGLDEETQKVVEAQSEKIVKAIERGRLVINDEGDAVYSYPKPDGETVEIVFSETDARTQQAMDKAKKGQTMAALQLAIAEHTGQSVTLFSKMKRRHYSVCQALTLLFFF